MKTIKLTLEMNGKAATTQIGEDLYERLKTQFDTNPLYSMVDVLQSELKDKLDIENYLRWELLRNQGLDSPLNDDIYIIQKLKK